MKNEAEKQQNPDIKEVKIGLSLVDSILNRAIFNHCSIILFDKSNPEKFDHEVRELASKHAHTATIYKDLEGNIIMASDLYFNPYSVKTIASVHKEYKEKVVDLLEGMGFEMRGKQYHISDVSYDRNEEEIRVGYENLTDGTEYSTLFSSFYYWLTNNEAETMSQFDFKELKDLWTEISAKEEEQENFKNQPEYGTNKGILKVLGENQDEIKEIRTDYSGRGMYGKECFGIVVESYSNIEDELEKYDVMGRKDNMGHDMIIYWPSLTYEKLKSEDTEGVLNSLNVSEASTDVIKELHTAEASKKVEIDCSLFESDEGEDTTYYGGYVRVDTNKEIACRGTDRGDMIWLEQVVNQVLTKLELDLSEDEWDEFHENILYAISNSGNGKVVVKLENNEITMTSANGGVYRVAINQAQSATEYALKPMIEDLESKGFKVIDEGSGDEITVYVYNTDEEFTEDIFLALIFGSTREYNSQVGRNPLPKASYELVDIVDSGFKSKYPGKYKQIEDIAQKHEKKDEADAVRMESLANNQLQPTTKYRFLKENMGMIKRVGSTVALHPEQKGGQEIKLRKIADKYIDEVAKHAHTGIVQHAILDPKTSDLNEAQISSVRKALVEVGNRNMGHDRVRKEGKEGVIAGSDIAEFASWITSDCMALTADYLMDNIGDRNAQETYTFAKSKLEDCLMDFYRTETNRPNYPEIYAFWEDLIYGQKAFGSSEEEVDFFTVYLMKEKTEDGIQFLCDLVSEAFDTSCSIVDNSAFNVYRKGKLKGNEKAEMEVSNLVGQSEILEIA